MNHEALELIERIVKFTLYKSMNQLRKRVKSTLISHGFKEELRNFKLVRQDNDTVVIYYRAATDYIDRFPEIDKLESWKELNGLKSHLL